MVYMLLTRTTSFHIKRTWRHDNECRAISAALRVRQGTVTLVSWELAGEFCCSSAAHALCFLLYLIFMWCCFHFLRWDYLLDIFDLCDNTMMLIATRNEISTINGNTSFTYLTNCCGIYSFMVQVLVSSYQIEDPWNVKYSKQTTMKIQFLFKIF